MVSLNWRLNCHLVILTLSYHWVNKQKEKVVGRSVRVGPMQLILTITGKYDCCYPVLLYYNGV